VGDRDVFLCCRANDCHSPAKTQLFPPALSRTNFAEMCARQKIKICLQHQEFDAATQHVTADSPKIAAARSGSLMSTPTKITKSDATTPPPPVSPLGTGLV